MWKSWWLKISESNYQSVVSTLRLLITFCSHINQQIALKTIKKLGFSVRAVWNGQEALDYLAEPATVKPNIVLMDVQMPVLDGVSSHILIVLPLVIPFLSYRTWSMTGHSGKSRSAPASCCCVTS